MAKAAPSGRPTASPASSAKRRRLAIAPVAGSKLNRSMALAPVSACIMVRPSGDQARPFDTVTPAKHPLGARKGDAIERAAGLARLPLVHGPHPEGAVRPHLAVVQAVHDDLGLDGRDMVEPLGAGLVQEHAILEGEQQPSALAEADRADAARHRDRPEDAEGQSSRCSRLDRIRSTTGTSGGRPRSAPRRQIPLSTRSSKVVHGLAHVASALTAARAELRQTSFRLPSAILSPNTRASSLAQAFSPS